MPPWLPAANTALIVISGLFLALGYAFIRRRRVQAHHRSMITATVFAALFLVVYVIRALTMGSHPFGGTGIWRAIYLVILVPHTALAIVVGPLALVTLRRAFGGRFADHRRIARVTLPIWAFVAVSTFSPPGPLSEIGGAFLTNPLEGTPFNREAFRFATLACELTVNGLTPVSCACVDIGSNTTRLLLAGCRGGTLRELMTQRVFTRLGRSIRRGGTFPPEKLAEMTGVVEQKVRHARELGADRIAIVATAARDVMFRRSSYCFRRRLARRPKCAGLRRPRSGG